MREGLSGLTARGRAFLAAGITAISCAVVLGQPALVRVGVLVAVLPLVAALVVGRGRHRLALVRTVTPQLVAAGQPATVRLEVVNEGRTPTGLLLLEEQLPYVLGTRPRFVVDGLGRGTHGDVSYQVRSDVRGRFPIGPMAVRVSDPFGLVELGRAFHTTTDLTVTPRTVPLPPIPLAGAWTGSGDNRPRAFATGSAEDVTVREYRHGDDLRRVHWRSSARTGELMVRREEQPWQSRATVFLDNRAAAHRGIGAASSLEAAVSAAASVAVHLSQRGFAVRLVTADGEDASTTWHDRSTSQNTRPLLEALAVVTASDREAVRGEWLSEAAHPGLLIAVLGAVRPDDGPVFRRMLQRGPTALALALDVGAWTGSPGGSAAEWLGSLGWRAVTASPTDRLPALWEGLATRGAVGGAAR